MSKIKIVSIIVVALSILGGGVYFFTHRNNTAYQFVTVARGPIDQTVSVTGNTTPTYSVSLGFGNSGIISNIYSAIGRRVAAGTLLATLDTGDLEAQRKQAEGNVETQKARLQGLQAGSRPEEIASSQASFEKGQQDLANMYASVSDVSNDSYTKANDAVRTQLNSFFSNGELGQAQLTYNTNNPQNKIDAEGGRISARTALSDWSAELNSFNGNLQQSALDTTIQQDLARITIIRNLLDNVSKTLNDSSSLNASTLASYQAYVGTAIAEVNTAIKNLNSEAQNIASQKLTVAKLQADLNLKKAGSTAEDISAQEAQVKQAEASVDSIKAKLRNSEIVAPQNGIVTQFDAKVGQIASPSTPLVSIISDNSFEIDATVPETDIGKVSLNNKVEITLDAFPGETFGGSIFYIDPAQTNASGVVGYKIKVSFDKVDSRLKSGLTANLAIATEHKDNALILPQYAILQTDQGTFVQVLENKAVKNIPVTLGIQDQKGNVEILSGVSDGQQVLNIGLKKS